ncbi:hypothetical protein SAG0023_06175 [Streptococcus agalactiae FSL S3-105]|nr:hypothetical protein SAG0030_03670 [Streptococcus agalactiae FSL S3-603]EPV89963.1 hypothetical protein SAG0023_06175 [Streptococcus agalactiae FSL S3-105]CQJ49432.1 Uncharacterised protein [Streptococcus agalactiae]SUN26726.1 Uncharacterised protein [Streptococcus agalactiae]
MEKIKYGVLGSSKILIQENQRKMTLKMINKEKI